MMILLEKIFFSGIILFLMIKYLKVIYDILKRNESVDYSFNFNIILNKYNKKIIFISSIINVFLLSIILYYYILNKSGIVIILLCSLFVINISGIKRKLNK